MSGATEARDTLRRRASSLYAMLRDAAASYVLAHQTVLAADDLVQAMSHTVSLIVATERLRDIATETEKTLRDALSSVMNDTGCTQLANGHHSAHLSRKPSFVDTFDKSLIPPEYMVPRDPVLDMKRIAAELKAGQLVPGCSLVKPNDMRLVIRAKETA